MSVRQVPSRHYTALDKRVSSTSIGLGILCTIIFTTVAYAAVREGYISTLIERLWNLHSEEVQESGGQWLVVLFVLVLKSIPGTGPSLLVAMTVTTAAYMLSVMAGILTRRGWSSVQIILFITALALHPLTLYAATTGQPFLLVAFTFACVILAADRLESIGDVQAQMAIGLALALLIITNPNGIYFIIPFLILLPIFYRQMNSVQSVVAGYIMVVLPCMIALVISFYVQIVFSRASLWNIVQLWLAPLHRPTVDLAQYQWLVKYRGDLGGSLGALLSSLFLFLPIYVAPALRLITSVRERKRPGTALAALIVPLLGGVVATYFGHAASAWTFLAAALAGSAIWIATSKITSRSSSILVAGLILGAIISWTSPEIWLDQEKIAWRNMVVNQFAEGIDSVRLSISAFLPHF